MALTLFNSSITIFKDADYNDFHYKRNTKVGPPPEKKLHVTTFYLVAKPELPVAYEGMPKVDIVICCINTC